MREKSGKKKKTFETYKNFNISDFYGLPQTPLVNKAKTFSRVGAIFAIQKERKKSQMKLETE